MNVREVLRIRPFMAVLAATVAVVALACAGGDDPTATSAPTATSPAPTATSPAPTATAPSGPTATAPADSTATSVPVATATSVPLTWIEQYMQSPGYKPEWGQPITGGTLKYGTSHTLNGHDPRYGHHFDGPQYLSSYNALLRIDPWVGLTSEIQGDLAESWEMSGDGLTLTFKLREGVKFHDNPNLPAEVKAVVSGDEFTCEDAKASIENNAKWPEGWGYWSDGPKFLAHFESAACPDGPLGYTFVVTWEDPLAKTIIALAAGDGMNNNMDKDYLEFLDRECQDCLQVSTSDNYLLGTGTGPFIPVEYQNDIISKMRRNPTYFREGLPLLDGMDQFILKDFTTRFTALVTGQIHYFGEGSASMLPGQVEQVQRDFSDRVTIDPALHTWGKAFSFNLMRPPFDDVRVRKALHIALNRDDWAFFKKAGTFEGVRQAAWMPPGTFWAVPDETLLSWPGWRQPKDEDIAEANRLLDEVYGAGNRFEFACFVSNSQMYIDGCLFLQDQVKRSLDIDMALDITEGAVRTERSNNGQFDITYGSGQSTGVGDPDDDYLINIVREFMSAGTRLWRGDPAMDLNPTLQEDLETRALTQSRELDPIKRQAMVWELEEMLTHDSIYESPMAWTTIFPAYTKAMRGWSQFDFGSQAKWTMWERVWLNDE